MIPRTHRHNLQERNVGPEAAKRLKEDLHPDGPPVPPFTDAIPTAPRSAARSAVTKRIDWQEHLIPGTQGDHVTIPLVMNTTIAHPDTTWHTPALTLCDKAIGSAFLPYGDLLAGPLTEMPTRMATPTECKWLFDAGYFPAGTSLVVLAPIPDLAAFLATSGGGRCAATASSLNDIPELFASAGALCDMGYRL